MKKNVLLIDDSVTIHRVIDLSIDAEKYEVTKVFSKEDAALKLTEKLYDFILLDNKLDNIVISEYIPFLKGRSVGCRVILLVGAFDKFDVADLEKSGADDYLVKPFDAQSLNAKLSLSNDEDTDDSDILEHEETVLQDNGEGVMAPNFVDGLAIADAMREEPHTGKKDKPKPVNDGVGIPAEMLSGTQYLSSLEAEENITEDDEEYHEEHDRPSEDEVTAAEDGLEAMLLDSTETDDMHHMLGALDPAATIRDDGEMTSEEASALEFLEKENMKALPATEDDIDNAQYAEDTLLGLEYMDPMISGDEETDALKEDLSESEQAKEQDDENPDHISDEQEIARIYGLDEAGNKSNASDNDFGLTAESYDTLPFDDTEENAAEAAVKGDSAFDEFEKCLEVMGADLAEDEAEGHSENCGCNDEHSYDAPHDEASGAGEEYIQKAYSAEKAAASSFVSNAAEPSAPSAGGITVTISREEIIAMIGQAIDKRFLEETIKTVLTENLREVIRTIVPAIAEKYIKEEIERLKDE